MATYVQQLITIFIVAIAAISVSRRLWAQIGGFRKGASDDRLNAEASACAGCGGCGASRPARSQGSGETGPTGVCRR